MPNDVRDASGSPWRMPGKARSQVRLDPLRQLIAQLSDVARAHQQKDVVAADQAFKRLACALEGTDVNAIGDQVGKIAGLDARRVFFAGAIDVEHEDAVGAGK